MTLSMMTLYYNDNITTLNIMTLNVIKNIIITHGMKLTIATLSQTSVNIATLKITTLNITTVRISTLSINTNIILFVS